MPDRKRLNVKHLGWFILLLIQCNILFCQKTKISFEQASLDEVLKTFESKTNLIFNYDPLLLQEHQFSGFLDVSNPQKSISKLLYDSPFEFEANEQTILVYKSEPKVYSFCGTIRDSLRKEPLVAANIFAQHNNQGVESDGNGFFKMTISGLKNQRISFSYLGFKTASFQLQEIDLGDCFDIFLAMDKRLWNEEIVVTDYILDGISEGQNYGGYQLNYQQLSKQHSVVEHDILKTAQLLPGIVSYDESVGNLQVRGSTPEQNLILWEGAAIYQPAHLFGMVSAINPFSVGEVNIYKGTHDPKYDNRVGGIVSISLPDSVKNKSKGSAGITFTEAHLNLETPILSEKLAVMLSGRKSIYGFYNSPALLNYTFKTLQLSQIDDFNTNPEEGLNTNQALDFYDWNTKIIFKPSKRLFLSAGWYHNTQFFKYDFSFSDLPYKTSDRFLSNSNALYSRLDWKTSKKSTTSISFSQSNYDNGYTFKAAELGSLLANNSQQNDILDQTASLSNKYKNGSFTLVTGYDYNLKSVSYDWVEDNVNFPYFEDLNAADARFHNLFSSIKFGNKKFSLDGGIRTSYYVEQSKWFHSPRLSFQYSINENLKVKGEGGVYHQFISQLSNFGLITNLEENPNPVWILNSSAGTSSQQAEKFAAGFLYKNNGWLLDVEGYYNHIEGLTTLSPIIDLFEINAFATGSSEALGLDFLIKKRWSKFNTWVNYSLGKIDYDFFDLSENSFPAPNDIRHNLNLVASYKIKDFQFVLNSNFHSGLPFTNPEGIIDSFFVDYGELNNDRLRQYFRIDLSANYRPTLHKSKNIKLEISLSVLNLLNRENVFAREHRVDEIDEVPTLLFTERTLLPIMPLVLGRVYW